MQSQSPEVQQAVMEILQDPAAGMAKYAGIEQVPLPTPLRRNGTA